MIRSLKWIWPFCLLFTAASCATTPEVRVEYVPVPVGVACIPRSIGDEREYSDSDEALRAAEDAAARFVILIMGREERKARLAEVEPVLASPLCRSP